MKSLLLIIILAFPFLSGAQITKPEGGNILLFDSSRVNAREIGLMFGGYTFNNFAPEWYLQKFGIHFSGGAFYRKRVHPFRTQRYASLVRLGFMYYGQNIKTEGGKYPEESIAKGKQRGVVFFAGYEKQIFKEKYFAIQLGADLCAATFNFHGQCQSYSGEVIYDENKKMNGIGLNPFVGCSYTFTNSVKISLEGSFSNWLIRQNTLLQDPNQVVKKYYFVSSPNPLSAVSVSYIF